MALFVVDNRPVVLDALAQRGNLPSSGPKLSAQCPMTTRFGSN